MTYTRTGAGDEIMAQLLAGCAGVLITVGVVSCGSPALPPLDEDPFPERPLDGGPSLDRDATTALDAGGPARILDASADNAARPAEAGQPNDGSEASDASSDAAPSGCTVVGPAPTTCAPAHVVCSGTFNHPAGIQHEGKCYVEWINQFYSACVAGSPAACAAFRAQVADAGPGSGLSECLACLVTPESAAQWGALVAASNGMLTPDVGGCIHDVTATSGCQSVLMTSDECLRVACAPGCGGDPADPEAEAAFQACETAAAADPQSCAPYVYGGSGCNEYDECTSGTDFQTQVLATMTDFCATDSECQPRSQGVPPALTPESSQPLHQNVCSSAQIEEFLAACDSDVNDASTGVSCADFRTANATCAGCLETDIDAGPIGASALDTVLGTLYLNTSGCVQGAATSDAGVACAAALWANVACDYDLCDDSLTFSGCSRTVTPTIACDQTANLGACSATVGPANDCTAMLLDAGGEAAQCVGYTNLEDAFRTLGTIFCGP